MRLAIQGGDARIDSSLQEPRSFHAQLLDSLFDGVYFVDVERRITYWNRGAEDLTGYAAPEVVGRRCSDNLLVHVDGTGCELCTHGCPLSEAMQDGQRKEARVFFRHKLGHRVPVCVRVAPILSDHGTISGAVEVFGDFALKEQTERRVRELEEIAFKDFLTGLPNRRYAELKIKQAAEECQEFGRRFGLLVLDIDHFKNVNDLHGHQAGDTILKFIGETLSKSLRGGDFVGRWGGEEFLVLIPDADTKLLCNLAERCRMLVEKSGAVVEGTRLTVSVSVGATLMHGDDSAESSIKRADRLMYASKSNGRNRTTVG